jgi:hypothetical protein
MSFVKLDCGILDSTLWVDREAREVFVTALLMAEPRELKDKEPVIKVDSNETEGFEIPEGWYGFVPAAGPGIVRRSGLDRDTGMVALRRLCSPDSESRTPDFDGRRMARVDGGYIIINYDKYRTKDHTSAERSKRYRENLRKKSVTTVTRDERVTDRSVTQAEAEAEVEVDSDVCEPIKLLEKSESTSFPSSETYDVPNPDRLLTEGRKEVMQISSSSSGKPWHKEEIFLKLADRLEIPTTYATKVYADLAASGFVAADGSEIVSPGAFLSALWSKDRSRETSREDGKRQPWQIEADLKRTKAEIAKITGDKSLRMAALGHTDTWEAHKLKLGSDWLKMVATLYSEAQEVLPGDVEKFQDWFAGHCAEMRRDGVPAAMLETEEYRLTQFQEWMPDEDVPPFAQWDREINPRPWVDPVALVPDAKAELDVLKAFERRLNNELREALR